MLGSQLLPSLAAEIACAFIIVDFTQNSSSAFVNSVALFSRHFREREIFLICDDEFCLQRIQEEIHHDAWALIPITGNEVWILIEGIEASNVLIYFLIGLGSLQTLQKGHQRCHIDSLHQSREFCCLFFISTPFVLLPPRIEGQRGYCQLLCHDWRFG